MELLATFAGSRGLATWSVANRAADVPAVAIAADLGCDRLDVTVVDSSGGPRSFSAPLVAVGRHELRTFVDGSLVEVFVDGDRALTTGSYAGDDAATVRFTATRSVVAHRVEGWSVRGGVIA